MARSRAGQQAPIRLVFELEREDDPRLYDDLIRFNKGQRRVNRLRTLAHDGVLVGVLPTADAARLAPPVGVDVVAQHATPSPALTGAAFDEPIGE